MAMQKRVARNKGGGGDSVRLPATRGGGDTIIKRMTSFIALTTDVSGNLSPSTLSSAVNGTTEFASLAARYLTYRVLKITWHYRPRRVVNTTTASDVVGSIVVARDPSGLAAPANATLAWAIAHSKVFSSGKSWDITIQASEEDHLLWTESSVAIPTTNRFALLARGNSFPTSVTLADLYVEYVVEWRGAQ